MPVVGAFVLGVAGWGGAIAEARNGVAVLCM